MDSFDRSKPSRLLSYKHLHNVLSLILDLLKHLPDINLSVLSHVPTVMLLAEFLHFSVAGAMMWSSLLRLLCGPISPPPFVR